MRLSLIAAGVVIVVSSIGCRQSASLTSPSFVSSGGPATTPSVAQDVPFKGSWEGTYTFAPDSPPSPFASVHLEATGQAAHLGRFTLNAPHRVNLGSVPVTATGTFEFTAANGDKLTADFTGVATFTETPGVASIVETATIKGGTGRFADATGRFTVERMVDLASPIATGSFEGTISAPGARNP